VRRERGTRPAPVQLATVVDEIKPLLRHALMINRLSLDADLPAALRPVRADRADVEHLLLRLVLGIVDAAPAGATITVEGRDDGDAVALRIAVNSTGAAPSVHGPRDGLAGTLGRAACEELAAELGGTLALDEAAGVLCGAHLRLPAWC
jgi:C4-dicarboxylate-specific signal transduction histidine kinase